jgi:Tfp pilus assembly major pilin PilA
MIQQHIATKIREYLPEIHAEDIHFDEGVTQPHLNDLKQFSESIQTWSHTVLEKEKLPTLAHEVLPLIKKYSKKSDQGCALRMVVELNALNTSIENNDASTAALASMKLLEHVWNSSIFRVTQETTTNRDTITPSNVAAKNVATKEANTSKLTTDDTNKHLYQETINNLKDKYPHCNVNALRLLAATRLNINKQKLDDLDITPE